MKGLINMQKIIFLEPINVLNSLSHRQRLMELNGGRYSSMMEEDLDGAKVQLLKDLLDETGAQIVICSEWRTCPIKMQGLMETLKKYGITLDQGIHSLMSFGERGTTKTKSMENHKRLLLNQDINTITAAIDSKMNDHCMEGDKVFHTLQEAEGMTVELKDFVASYLGKAVDR